MVEGGGRGGGGPLGKKLKFRLRGKNILIGGGGGYDRNANIHTPI